MRVQQLWRFPVKSMGGTRVDRVHMDRRGVHADRLWAVRDIEKNSTASARRIPALLGCSARYLAEPGADAGPGNAPAVLITFPDGRELTGDDPAVDIALSELVGRPMRLVSLSASGDEQHRMSVQEALANYAPAQVREDFGLDRAEDMPDTSMFSAKQIITLARYTTPPGTFVDLSPVHLMTAASLRQLAPRAEAYDVRRFRPNVLVDTDEDGPEFPESGWVGRELSIGSARLHVTVPTIRCVVPTRAQPDIELDKTITRQLAARTDRFLGVYADVRTPGVVRVGDDVSVHPESAPNAAQRAASAATKVATKGIQRLLEKTLLRES